MGKKTQEVVRRGFDQDIESLISQLNGVAVNIIQGRVHFEDKPGNETFMIPERMNCLLLQGL
jgi:hypothetical protein